MKSIQTEKIKKLKSGIRKLRKALEAAEQHLDYCGWGRDEWERSGSNNLQKKINAAFKTAEKLES